MIKEFRTWQVEAGIEAIKAGDALLWIMAEDPDLLLKQDPERVAAFQNTNMGQTASLWDLVSQNVTNWAVISAPVDGWAGKIFYDLPVESRKALILEIFFISAV